MLDILSRIAARAVRVAGKIRRRSPAERRALVVAFCHAAVVAGMLHALPFRRVCTLLEGWARWLSAPGTRPLRNEEEQRLLWAVEAASRRILPARPCLTQALTARLLLSRRGGEPGELRIGVARDPGGELRAHAWVERRGAVLIGGTASPETFTTLAEMQERDDVEEWEG